MKKFIPVLISLIPIFLMVYDFKHFWLYVFIYFAYIENYSRIKNLLK